MTAAGRATRGGFTLIEVVIAMVALALVAGICYAAFQLGIRAVERGEVVVVTAQRLRAATDVLIRQVKSVVPYAVRNSEEDVYPYFVGTATSMSFITGAGQLGGGGLARVTYRVEGDPPQLLLEESAFFDPDGLGRDTPQASPPAVSVILDGFRTLQFEYCLDEGMDDPEAATQCEWQSTWDGLTEEIMPLAVRVLVDGLPGIEGDRWGQEIPLMATAYGEEAGAIDEESIAECDTGLDEAADAAEAAADGAAGGRPGVRPGAPGSGAGGLDPDVDPDEGVE